MKTFLHSTYFLEQKLTKKNKILKKQKEHKTKNSSFLNDTIILRMKASKNKGENQKKEFNLDKKNTENKEKDQREEEENSSFLNNT